MSASPLAAIGNGPNGPSRVAHFAGAPLFRPIEDAPSLRGLTFEEINATADLLGIEKARYVDEAARHGFLHGVDFCPEGCFAVALLDREQRAIEVQVLAGKPYCRDRRGRPVWRLVFGERDWPIGCDSLPLFKYDECSEIYLVHGIGEFLAAQALYVIRSKRVFAMPVPSPIPAEALKAFAGRHVWTPEYRSRAALAVREIWRQQFCLLGPKVSHLLRISLREERFADDSPAKSLVDMLAIRAEQREQEKRERQAGRRMYAESGGVH